MAVAVMVGVVADPGHQLADDELSGGEVRGEAAHQVRIDALQALELEGEVLHRHGDLRSQLGGLVRPSTDDLQQFGQRVRSRRRVRLAGGHPRRTPAVDGGDDLFGVAAAEVHRGRAEARMAELALDQVKRHALASELDGMRVAQPPRREAAPDTRVGGEPAERDADVRARPRPIAGLAVSAAGSTDQRGCSEPRVPQTHRLGI